MSRVNRLLRSLALLPPEMPPEIIAAIFSTAAQSGLTTAEAFGVTGRVAEGIDPELSEQITDLAARLDATVDRHRTYSQAAALTDSKVLGRLLLSLNSAEQTGEDIVERGRQIFETLTIEREAAVSRRAETYPLIMIVVMVLFFLPAIVILLVGPLYVSLMQILNSI